jgi:hypothetical protein
MIMILCRDQLLQPREPRAVDHQRKDEASIGCLPVFHPGGRGLVRVDGSINSGERRGWQKTATGRWNEVQGCGLSERAVPCQASALSIGRLPASASPELGPFLFACRRLSKRHV